MKTYTVKFKYDVRQGLRGETFQIDAVNESDLTSKADRYARILRSMGETNVSYEATENVKAGA